MPGTSRSAAAKHRDTKTLSGFGEAGILEVIKDFRGDTFCAVPRDATEETKLVTGAQC